MRVAKCIKHHVHLTTFLITDAVGKFFCLSLAKIVDINKHKNTEDKSEYLLNNLFSLKNLLLRVKSKFELKTFKMFPHTSQHPLPPTLICWFTF